MCLSAVFDHLFPVPTEPPAQADVITEDNTAADLKDGLVNETKSHLLRRHSFLTYQTELAKTLAKASKMDPSSNSFFQMLGNSHIIADEGMSQRSNRALCLKRKSRWRLWLRGDTVSMFLKDMYKTDGGNNETNMDRPSDHINIQDPETWVENPVQVLRNALLRCDWEVVQLSLRVILAHVAGHEYGELYMKDRAAIENMIQSNACPYANGIFSQTKAVRQGLLISERFRKKHWKREECGYTFAPACAIYNVETGSTGPGEQGPNWPAATQFDVVMMLISLAWQQYLAMGTVGRPEAGRPLRTYTVRLLLVKPSPRNQGKCRSTDDQKNMVYAREYSAYVRHSWLQDVVEGRIVLTNDVKDLFWPGVFTAKSSQIFVLGCCPQKEWAEVHEESASLPRFQHVNPTTGKDHHGGYSTGKEVLEMLINIMLHPCQKWFERYHESGRNEDGEDDIEGVQLL